MTPPLTPAEALTRLQEGNRRFAAGNSLAPNRSLDRLREIAPSQRPFAACLSCADSRVPVELLFDQGFGDLFVVRVAGNIAAAEQIASLEFAAAMLEVKVIYVLGHSGCGAVAAAVKGDAVPGQISALFRHLRPAVRAAAGDAERAVRLNAVDQAETLAESSPLLRGLAREGKLVVAAGVYDLGRGLVEPLPVGSLPGV